MGNPPVVRSEFQYVTSAFSQSAWYLAALLLYIGHPSRPADLASHCSLFKASAEFVEFLCLIPNSPISLTEDLFVTLSPVTLIIYLAFLFKTNLIGSFFLPRIEPRKLMFSVDYNSFRTYLRKRKRRVYSHTGILPAAKKGVILDSENVERMDQAASPSQSTSSKEIDNWNIINGHIPSPLLFSKSSTLPCLGWENVNAKLITIVSETEADFSYCMPEEAKSEKASFARKMNLSFSKCGHKEGCMSAEEDDNCSGTHNHVKMGMIQEKETSEGKMTLSLSSLGSKKMAKNLLTLYDNDTFLDVVPKNNIDRTNENNNAQHLIAPNSTANSQNASIWLQPNLSATREQLLNVDGKDMLAQSLQTSFRKSEYDKNIEPSVKKRQRKRGNLDDGGIHSNNNQGKSFSLHSKDQGESKVLPNFECYIVEEEEGSGGYGTVYRARKKSDGAIVAIKCPHARSRGQHVINELNILEQFGGQNFIIKYEGCFKNGKFDCLVLEHIQHDRPEVLRREIGVAELRWYGYCLFRALATLHKQGVVHRDVKPGNFLFSRKAKKGYLIDFNLALDLYWKFGNTGKSRRECGPSVDFVRGPISATKNRKPPNAVSSSSMSKPTLDLNKLKKNPQGHTSGNSDLSSWNVIKSQVDVSSITLVKDVTSTKNSSVDGPREPLPCRGRKELLNLLQEAIKYPKQEASSVPASMRKRVAAPCEHVGSKLMYITPMPLHSDSFSTAGAGLTKIKGDGKQKREGPCVGTKGFRSPEVLFKSPHQGPKIDIWSAGVTLLYFMIGRTPFAGDPEQNIKEIARLRGSEGLWEVAKLHNCESSFPLDLYNIRSLSSVSLRDWCVKNTRRPEFMDMIPQTLFDLVDMCLKVNPRLRISADEALGHEFFAPCNESVKKLRLSGKQCISKSAS